MGGPSERRFELRGCVHKGSRPELPGAKRARLLQPFSNSQADSPIARITRKIAQERGPSWIGNTPGNRRDNRAHPGHRRNVQKEERETGMRKVMIKSEITRRRRVLHGVLLTWESAGATWRVATLSRNLYTATKSEITRRTGVLNGALLTSESAGSVAGGHALQSADGGSVRGLQWELRRS